MTTRKRNSLEIEFLQGVAKLENGDESAKQTETEDLKSTAKKMIHVQDCERLREALENQGLRAKRSFSDRPSEWRHEEKEAKKRRTSGLRSQGMEEEDK